MLYSGYKSPFKYMGGKSRLAPWIIKHFPPHSVYVEPFGGAAHVLVTKAPASLEVYNDINGSLVNLFKIMQDPSNCAALSRLLRLTPYSRQFFREIRDGKYSPSCGDKNIQDAYRTLVLMKQGFSGDWMSRSPSWSFDRRKAYSCQSFKRLPEALHSLTERLKSIQVDDLDFRKCITRYDSPDTLFYCDPPYWKKEHYYSGNFNRQDHRDLASLLNSVRGKVCISYYPFPGLDDLYPASRWRTVKKKVSVFSPISPESNKRRHAEEILIMNYGEPYSL